MARDPLPLPEGWPIQQLAEPIGVFAVEAQLMDAFPPPRTLSDCFLCWATRADPSGHQFVRLRGHVIVPAPVYSSLGPPIPLSGCQLEVASVELEFAAPYQSNPFEGTYTRQQVADLIRWSRSATYENCGPRDFGIESDFVHPGGQPLGAGWVRDGVLAVDANVIAQEIIGWLMRNAPQPTPERVIIPVPTPTLRIALSATNQYGVSVRDLLRAAMLTDILTIDDFVRRRPEQSASDKSIDLLKRWLSPAQLDEFEKNGSYYFSVVGSAGGRYRILRTTAYNIVDEAGQKFCLVPAGASAVGDIMLAQKIAFETDEPGALRKANRPAATRTAGEAGGHISNCTFGGGNGGGIGIGAGGSGVVINYDDA